MTKRNYIDICNARFGFVPFREFVESLFSEDDDIPEELFIKAEFKYTSFYKHIKNDRKHTMIINKEKIALKLMKLYYNKN